MTISFRVKLWLGFLTVVLLVGLVSVYFDIKYRQAKLNRALDASTLAAMGNLDLPTATSPENNRELVALLMRNVAAANDPAFTSLSSTPTVSRTTNEAVTLASGQKVVQYQLVFNSSPPGTSLTILFSVDGNQKILVASDCGQSETIWGVIHGQSDSPAIRQYRLTLLVLDRGVGPRLAPAVLNYLSYFDPRNDLIGMVSYDSKARLDFPLHNDWITPMTNLVSTNLPPVSTRANSAPDEALDLAVKQLESDPYSDDADHQKCIMLVCGSPWRAGMEERLVRVADLARQKNIAIYAIGYGPDITDKQCQILAQVAHCQQYQTTTLTNATNVDFVSDSLEDRTGSMYFAKDDVQLEAELESVAAFLNGYPEQ